MKNSALTKHHFALLLGLILITSFLVVLFTGFTDSTEREEQADNFLILGDNYSIPDKYIYVQTSNEASSIEANFDSDSSIIAILTIPAEELEREISGYQTKQGGGKTNTVLSVMAFIQNQPRIYSETIASLGPLPDNAIESDEQTGMYKISPPGDIFWYYSNLDPRIESHSQDFTLARCIVILEGYIEHCRFNVQINNTNFNFHISHNNLHLYREIVGLFFSKLEEWKSI